MKRAIVLGGSIGGAQAPGGGLAPGPVFGARF